MMEKALLAVVLIVAVVGLVRIVRNSIGAGSGPSKSPACGGCPFESKCQMQSRPHAGDCGDVTDDS